MSYYEVYLLVTLGMPRNHHSIYILTSQPTSPSNPTPTTSSPPPSTTKGYIYQVSGNIQTGMIHAHRPALNPEKEADFISKERIGYVTVQDYESGKVKEICDVVSAPKKQFEGPRRLFPRERVRRCQEWTWEAVETLRGRAVLVGDGTGYGDYCEPFDLQM